MDSSTVRMAVAKTLETGRDEAFHGPGSILTRLLQVFL